MTTSTCLLVAFAILQNHSKITSDPRINGPAYFSNFTLQLIQQNKPLWEVALSSGNPQRYETMRLLRENRLSIFSDTEIFAKTATPSGKTHYSFFVPNTIFTKKRLDPNVVYFQPIRLREGRRLAGLILHFDRGDDGSIRDGIYKVSFSKTSKILKEVTIDFSNDFPAAPYVINVEDSTITNDFVVSIECLKPGKDGVYLYFSEGGILKYPAPDNLSNNQDDIFIDSLNENQRTTDKQFKMAMVLNL